MPCVLHVILLQSQSPYSPSLLATLFSFAFRHPILLHALLATLFSFNLNHPIIHSWPPFLLHSWLPYSPSPLATIFSFTPVHPILLTPLPPNSITVAVVVDAGTPHSSITDTIGNRQIDKQANVWQMISHCAGTCSHSQ